MRFIPTRTHAILDYLMGVVLIISPWLFGFALGGAETWVPVILGIAALVYSLMTDYEFSLTRRIPMPTHLGLDLASGLVLAISPWLFGFADFVWMPHVFLGLIEIVAALTTQKVPSRKVVEA